ALMFGALIALITAAWRWAGLGGVTAFWAAYVLTRPLGASIGDYLSQARGDGGLGLGTVATTFLFLGTILGLVIFLTLTKKDQELVKVPVGGHAATGPGRSRDPI